MRVLLTVFAALFGLAFGSFLNVCLARWPEGESIVRPASHCRACNRALKWWENIPLLSWLALRGRCRTCGAWIGVRYPLAEAAVAVLWSIYAWRLGSWSAEDFGTAYDLADWIALLTGSFLLIWILLALAFLDAEYLWLPDQLTYSGVILGLAVKSVTIIAIAHRSATDAFSNYHFGAWEAFGRHSIGVILSAGIVLLFRWFYKLVRKREGLGLGDAKLMALLAAWLGLPGALLAFGIGSVLGAVAALALLAVPGLRRDEGAWAQQRLPLGTFLCMGGIASALWGQPIIAAYLRWAGF